MDHPLKQRFLRFADSECRGSSELYYNLSLAIADDEELLEIAESASEGQPVPNLFFGAVHYLLSSSREEPLATYYPSLAALSTRSPEDAFPTFRSFVLSRREKIVELLATRLVQTNEVRRCAYLFPSMVFAARWFKGRPLALIEIGTSAGLNLLWDKYSYGYGERDALGDAGSPVSIRSELRGDIPDFFFDPMPQITQRIGLDLNIVDAQKPDEAAWLRALIWPEHEERRDVLDAALQCRSAFQLDLRQGDGFSMLMDVISEIPKESVACIYHTHVANQVGRDTQETLFSELAELGKARDLIHIFNNIKPTLHLSVYKNGIVKDIPLARTDGHAKWFEWLPTRNEGEQGVADQRPAAVESKPK